MAIKYGSDGSTQVTVGNVTFTNNAGASSTQTTVGNVTFQNSIGGNGQFGSNAATTIGNVTFTGNTNFGSIQRAGNVWTVGNRSYTWVGSTLTGNGKTWTNVRTEADVRAIILEDY